MSNLPRYPNVMVDAALNLLPDVHAAGAIRSLLQQSFRAAEEIERDAETKLELANSTQAELMVKERDLESQRIAIQQERSR
jgi:hypothetical protein